MQATSERTTSGRKGAKQVEREQALATLREWFKPGDTVYTILRHVSRSGMQREIGVLASLGAGDFRHPNYAVGLAIGAKLGKHDSVTVTGCGMDMGFHVAYNLSYALYPEGFTCTGKDCPSNDHTNGDRDYTPHHHRDGGYALRHRWL